MVSREMQQRIVVDQLADQLERSKLEDQIEIERDPVNGSVLEVYVVGQDGRRIPISQDPS